MNDCSKTENYLNEKARMTKLRKLPHGGYLCTLKCCECPLSYQHNGTSEKIPCTDFETVYPQRTYLTEFLKHYPNTLFDDDGTPKGICLYALGLINKDDCDNNCVKCWAQSIG